MKLSVALLAILLSGCAGIPVTEIEGAGYWQANPYYREPEKPFMASLKVRAYLCKKQPVAHVKIRPFTDYLHLSNPAVTHEKHFVGDLFGAGLQAKYGECR